MNSDSPSPENPPRKRRAVSAARREYQRTTRGATPKKVHELKFELVK